MALSTGFSVTSLIADVIGLLILLILIEAIVSNVIAFGGRLSPYHPWVRALRRVVSPILDPIRRLLPPYKMGGWDLSPIIAIVALSWLRSLLYR